MNRSREEGAAASRSAMDYAGDGRPALTTNDALLYLREVKQRFQHRKEVYDTFLDIMKDFKAHTIDISTVINKVKTLLRGHEDLILGFNTFLPKGSEITLEDLHREEVPPPAPQIRPAVELDQAIAYINRIKTRFSDNTHVYKNFLEILCCFRQGRMDIADVYRDVADLFQHHEDLLEEFAYFLPDRSDDGGGAYGGEIFPLGRPMAPFSANSNDPYSDLNRRRMESSRRLRDFDWDLGVFDEIKSRLNNRDAYNDLLKCVNLFAQDVITKTELVGLGTDVLGRFPDVMARFREFVASIPGEDEVLNDARGGRDVSRGAFGHYQRNRAMIQQRNKYVTRPISELDTSDLERPTTSYILLPSDYPSMACSGKTALGREVLQDCVASVTTGTEDGSFKHMRKNQYEEALFRAEDERYDVELIIDRTRSAIKALIPVQEHIDLLSPDAKASYTLPPNTLRAFHVRTIEKIYGEKGNSVCQLLKDHPVVSVPVVLCRLQQKLEEWMGVLKTMNGHWQSVADVNYHKSLDHRSFYFKQQDKKSLAAKTLLQELKDESETARTNQRCLSALSALSCLIVYAPRLLSFSSGIPVQSLFVPHLQFSFDDVGVHEDLFNIVRFASSKMLTPDVWKQV